VAAGMNLFRWIYPLSLRQALFARLHSVLPPLSLPSSLGFPLVFGALSLKELVATDHGHRFIAWCGFYDLRLSQILARLAVAGGTLVDVGANAGYFSILWAGYNPNNRALAFEASPRNQKMLRANIDMNGLSNRVELFPFALGRFESMKAFDLGPAEQTGWGGLSLAPSASTIQVKVRALDGVISPDQPISALKIDTEGADLWVLMGAEQLLRRKQIQNIFYEFNRERMQSLGIRPGEPELFLSQFQYKVTRLSDEQFHATPHW